MTCACGCGKPVAKRKGAKYASARCRAAESRKRRSGIPGVVRSVRRLKSGAAQVILHVPALWAPQAHVRHRGEDLNLVKP